MQRSALRFSRSMLCCSLPALIALPAIAGTPEALDRVPADAQAVVVVPALGEMLNDINTINALLGDGGEPMVNFITAMIRGMPGINLEGSMAAVLSMEEHQEEPDMVLLIPMNDFGAFTNGQEGVNGVHEMPMGDQTMFLRDLGGGYAVMGEIAEDVREYNGAAGNLKNHAKALGRAGGRIADHNDIFVYVNITQFQDEIAMGLQEMEAQGEMIEMMGGAEAAQGFDQMVDAMKTVANDAMSFAAGLNFDQNAGISFDFGLQFKDGSSSSEYLNNNGNAGKYFANVPNMDYFFAASYDMSGEGIQRFLTEYMDMVAKMDTTGAMGGFDLKGMMSGVKGGIQVMGASDNIMGGLFTNTLYYAEVDNPKAFIDKTREMYAGMGEGMAEAGMQMTASVDQEATEINGVQAYAFEMSMDMSQMQGMNGMGGPNPAMIMQMMFGGEGPSGYMAPAGDNGLVVTMSQNASLLTKAVNASNGKGSMADVAAIQKTRDMLPDNRIMEMYIGADHLANTAGPMAMMFGLIPEFEPVDALPPLGMALTADGGGMLFRTVVPMQTIDKAMSIFEEMSGMQHQGNDDQMDF
jgi:hypothetical protein